MFLQFFLQIRKVVQNKEILKYHLFKKLGVILQTYKPWIYVDILTK